MKNLVILVMVILGILVLGSSCTDYQALYLQKNSEVESVRANANALTSSYNAQLTALQQENASLRDQLNTLQSQYAALANRPPQIQYVEIPVYRDRYVEVPVYIPNPPAPRPPKP